MLGELGFRNRADKFHGLIDDGFRHTSYRVPLGQMREFGDLDNIRHVQGSWVTQGSKIGQVSLSFGADDLGSIMIEENVVYAAGARNRMTQPEMRRLIADEL